MIQRHLRLKKMTKNDTISKQANIIYEMTVVYDEHDAKVAIVKELEKIFNILNVMKKDCLYLAENTEIENKQKVHEETKYNRVIDEVINILSNNG